MVNIQFQFDVVSLIVGIVFGFVAGLIIACVFYKKDYAHGYSDGHSAGWLKQYINVNDAYAELRKKYMNLSNESVADKRKIVVLEEKLKEEKENHAK